MDDLFFQDKSEIYNIILKKEAYKQILWFCNKANPYETGGVLIGNYSQDQTTANILQITPPPKNSKHAKYSFHRGSSGLKKILDTAWNQRQYYLGEWHYHPNFSAHPSNTDLRQMITLSKKNGLKCPEPILIIIGGNSKDWRITIGVIANDEYVSLNCK